MRTLIFSSLLAVAWHAHAEGADTHVWTLGLEIGYAQPSTDLDTWLDSGLSKLRYGAADQGLVANHWFGEYHGRLNPAWTVNVAADGVDDASSGVDVTDAYVTWRPIPHSANRQQWKIGLFQPPWSIENTDPGWRSPYTLSPSAINTWIGEELRPLGAEWSMRRRLAGHGGRHEIGLHAAAFVHNDPAGSLLVWKGWSLHDRESRFGDELPLAALPQIQPSGMFSKQAPYVAPWREVDGRVGYYLGADWRLGQRVRLAAALYDNRADPLQIERGQYAWHTRFEHIGTQLELPLGLGLLAQWMRGTTVMGPVLVDARAVDTDFDAYYVLVTKRIAAHRVSVRYDDFSVTDNDLVPYDDNTDDGHAWTIAYRYRVSPRWSVGLEWLEIRSRHPAWEYFGEPASADERLLQLRVAMHLGNR